MSANIERINPAPFQKSTFKLLFLCLITLGLYGTYRQYTMSRLLKENGVQHKLGKSHFLALFVLQAFNILAPFFLVMTSPRYLYLTFALSLAALVINLLLRECFIRYGEMKLNWFLTLVFGIIYLQYRLNHPKFGRTGTHRRSRDLTYTAAFTLTVLLLITARNMFHPYRIPTPSMEPAVMSGDRVLGRILEANDLLERGDIVTFQWKYSPDVTHIKRVLGVAGDTVFIEGQDVKVNGQSICQPSPDASLPPQAEDQKASILLQCKLGETTFHMTRHSDKLSSEDMEQEVTVPKGFVFLVGDNLDNSVDSRSLGAVARIDVEGKVQYIWWSMRDMQFFWHRFLKKLH